MLFILIITSLLIINIILFLILKDKIKEKELKEEIKQYKEIQNFEKARKEYIKILKKK